jgi:MFS family permease
VAVASGDQARLGPAGRAERFLSAIRAGLRYARSSRPLRATLVRSAGFFLFGSALWALLPLIARGPLTGGPGLYGALLTCVGAGAVAGAMLLPALKARLGADLMVALGMAALAAAMAALALYPLVTVALPACVLAGLAWISVLSSLNVSAQMALPAWVRSRGLAVNLAVFFGSMVTDSILWGWFADRLGLDLTLLVAAAGAVLGIAITWRWKLLGSATADLSPSAHWPVPILAHPLADAGGPVLVTVEYEVDPANRTDFTDAIALLAEERRRDGAFFWHVFADAETPAAKSRPSCSTAGSTTCASTSG